ncbi:hypothetical protein MLD38_001508 [Melastoma candidum]|uniref:Uncharacterized protein n=1 Tax=Melastoma candidum TaxID=119954 RepID=A0ACB9SID8_9MYRT|nr:hypothetical protein MLD38_001508 [Melastoma candidum]
MAGRIRSSLPLLRRMMTIPASDSFPGLRSSSAYRPLLSPSPSESLRNYATAPAQQSERVKVPIAYFAGTGKYASALFISAVKANALDKVLSDLTSLAEASKRSPTFAQFMMDKSVPVADRIKATAAIADESKFHELTKNFLMLLSENMRLKHLDTISEKFTELAMAHKGEVKAIITTVIPLPAEEEKELKETLQDVIGQGKKVFIEQKIDPSILGGLVVQFDRKVFDMSIRTRALQMERFLREPIVDIV